MIFYFSNKFLTCFCFLYRNKFKYNVYYPTYQPEFEILNNINFLKTDTTSFTYVLKNWFQILLNPVLNDHALTGQMRKIYIDGSYRNSNHNNNYLGERERHDSNSSGFGSFRPSRSRKISENSTSSYSTKFEKRLSINSNSSHNSGANKDKDGKLPEELNDLFQSKEQLKVTKRTPDCFNVYVAKDRTRSKKSSYSSIAKDEEASTPEIMLNGAPKISAGNSQTLKLSYIEITPAKRTFQHEKPACSYKLGILTFKDLPKVPDFALELKSSDIFGNRDIEKIKTVNENFDLKTAYEDLSAECKHELLRSNEYIWFKLLNISLEPVDREIYKNSDDIRDISSSQMIKAELIKEKQEKLAQTANKNKAEPAPAKKPNDNPGQQTKETDLQTDLNIPGYFIVPYDETKANFKNYGKFIFNFGHDQLSEGENFLNSDEDSCKIQIQDASPETNYFKFSFNPTVDVNYDNHVYLEKYFYKDHNEETINRCKRKFRKARHQVSSKYFPKSWDDNINCHYNDMLASMRVSENNSVFNDTMFPSRRTSVEQSNANHFTMATRSSSHSSNETNAGGLSNFHNTSGPFDPIPYKTYFTLCYKKLVKSDESDPQKRAKFEMPPLPENDFRLVKLIEIPQLKISERNTHDTAFTQQLEYENMSYFYLPVSWLVKLNVTHDFYEPLRYLPIGIMPRILNFINSIDLYNKICNFELPKDINQLNLHQCDNSGSLTAPSTFSKRVQNKALANLNKRTNWQLFCSVNESLKEERQKSEPLENAIEYLTDYNNNSVELTKIMEALTCSTANDFINFECFETLGDVFLKFVYCDYLIHSYENADEGDLNNLKSQFTSNLILWKLGSSAFDIEQFIINREPVYMNYKDHVRTENLDEYYMKTNLVVPNVLPAHNKIYKPTIINSKQVADTIEALIGMFLLNAGFIPAKNFIQKLGIKITSTNSLFFPNPKTNNDSDSSNYHSFRCMFDNLKIGILENTIKYRFDNKFLILTALKDFSIKNLQNFGIAVMPSHRYKFLGNAIIDFIISYEIYKNADPKRISPGYLTELRSSLIARPILGRLAFEIGLDKHVYRSNDKDPTVTTLVNKFRKNYIKENVSFGSRNSVKDIKWKEFPPSSIPKQLPSLFEGLIGAIYLDTLKTTKCSLKSLQKVWKVLEPLYKDRIKLFTQIPPLNIIQEVENLDLDIDISGDKYELSPPKIDNKLQPKIRRLEPCKDCNNKNLGNLRPDFLNKNRSHSPNVLIGTGNTSSNLYGNSRLQSMNRLNSREDLNRSSKNNSIACEHEASLRSISFDRETN